MKHVQVIINSPDREPVIKDKYNVQILTGYRIGRFIFDIGPDRYGFTPGQLYELVKQKYHDVIEQGEKTEKPPTIIIEIKAI